MNKEIRDEINTVVASVMVMHQAHAEQIAALEHANRELKWRLDTVETQLQEQAQEQE